jgi:hypothetical protein
VAALDAAALRGPIDESLKLAAMAPTQLEKLFGVEIGSFFAEEGFEAPLDVRALPRREAVAARGNPVIAKRPKHLTLPSGRVPSLED